MTTDEIVAKHLSYCQIARDLMVKKNHDYGNSWEADRDTTLTDTIRHKIDRIISLEYKQSALQSVYIHESIEDNLIDIINYCVFRLIKEDQKNVTSGS